MTLQFGGMSDVCCAYCCTKMGSCYGMLGLERDPSSDLSLAQAYLEWHVIARNTVFYAS